MRPRIPLLVLLPVAALATAGCGGSNQTAAIPSASPPSTSASTPTPASPALPAALQHKPTVALPKGPAPTHLVIRDLIKGTGALAAPGQTVSVQYVGVLYHGGAQFDASWDRGQPFSFPLGQGQVIPGWDQGIPGMRVGGRRELVIPAALAYGAQGSPPKIGPNQPLVFVVDLDSIG